jgi:virginiamycin A acetyltransferase
VRDAVKSCVRLLAVIVVSPRILAFRICAAVIGPDRALEGATQALASIPGLRGQYLRRAFVSHAGVRCHPSAAIGYGTIFSKTGAVIEENVYVGPRGYLGLVHLERDVLLGAGVHVPSGGRIHGVSDPDTPIREQPGTVALVRIGAGTWVGSAVVVLADIGRDCIIGAGSVVTTPLPDRVVAAGVPARIISTRDALAERERVKNSLPS